ncbi:MAG TPA: hypothetical protein VFA07_07530 [Chthonomonadaceae bacterium]|nr:hypothetical protein [Chthonomonadaceae bacterium]
MLLRFTRGKNDKPDTLTCVREDGSSTWEPSKVGIPHDLLHYAVETTLGYRNAFYGLVAGGRDIASFGTKNGVKDVYSDEELWAESIVGMLQWPAMGGSRLSEAESLALIENHFEEHGQPVPPLTVEQLVQIRMKARELLRQWGELEEGEVLELRF